MLRDVLSKDERAIGILLYQEGVLAGRLSVTCPRSRPQSMWEGKGALQEAIVGLNPWWEELSRNPGSQ